MERGGGVLSTQERLIDHSQICNVFPLPNSHENKNLVCPAYTDIYSHGYALLKLE